MTPWYESGGVQIMVGHVLDVLAEMPASSVQCCVTSPPYWGLRSYSTEPQIWGGDLLCSHSLKETAPGKVLTGGTGTASARQVTNAGSQYGNAWETEYRPPKGGSSAHASTLNGAQTSERYRATIEGQYQPKGFTSATCTRCGAWRGELGSEPIPDCLAWARGQAPCSVCFVCHLVTVFRAVRRVLHDSGTCWVNLGDSYNGSGKGPGNNGLGASTIGRAAGTSQQEERQGFVNHLTNVPGLGPKQLLMMPARVALALQAPYYPPRTIREERDRAWMAALIDGEGCISIRKHTGRRTEKNQVYQDTFIAFLAIGNNDREILDHCVAITRRGTVGIKDRPNVDRRGIVSRRDYHGWRLDANPALDVIRDAYPFLIAKRKQAILVHTLDLLNKGSRALRGNGPVSAAEQEKRAYLKTLINRCNQREPVDLPTWCEEPKYEPEPGWIVRSDIIWNKPNPMPESVTDRPTKSHEYLFLLSKRADYYFDSDAVREKAEYGRREQPNGALRPWGNLDQHQGGRTESGGDPSTGRNIRSVWTIPTESYEGAHFATFPRKLVEPCVLAGTSARGQCPACGAPWRRETTTHYEQPATRQRPTSTESRERYNGDTGGVGYRPEQVLSRINTTRGWASSCACDAGDPVPQVCMDIFAGSGTTLYVARHHGRRAIGIELSPEYAQLCANRLKQGVLPFLEGMG